LLQPIPELDLAAKLLDASADALMNGNLSLARELIAKADFPQIIEYAIRLVGPMTETVHRQTKRPKVLPKSQRDPIRMPSQKIQESIFSRDRWRCRFCGTKVISRKARSVLIKYFPEETHWTSEEFRRHTALYSMAVSLDHVVPHGRGGSNNISNLITTCYCCQFGRGEWTLEEMELFDPRGLEPIVDAWDGLSRLKRFRARAI